MVHLITGSVPFLLLELPIWKNVYTFTNPSAPAFALVVPRQMNAESTLKRKERFKGKKVRDQDT